MAVRGGKDSCSASVYEPQGRSFICNDSSRPAVLDARQECNSVLVRAGRVGTTIFLVGGRDNEPDVNASADWRGQMGVGAYVILEHWVIP